MDIVQCVVICMCDAKGGVVLNNRVRSLWIAKEPQGYDPETKRNHDSGEQSAAERVNVRE
jgi:hypothetical protein